jgi:hypothetical protein
MRWTVFLEAAIGTVLLGAALAKVGSGGSLRPFLSALALPPELCRLLAYVVPVFEAICGLLLLFGLGLWPAVGATVLSTGFVAVLFVARRSDVRVGCRCFGAWDSAPTTYVSIARALVLAVASGFLLALCVASTEAPGLDTDPATGAALLLGGLAAVEYVTVFALIGRVHDFLRHHQMVRARIAAVREGRTASP